MRKQETLFLDDILEAIEKIDAYKKGYSYQKFTSNSMMVDAILRNLEIIGEATKKIPADHKNAQPQIPWKKIAGIRDILIHEYFGVNLEIIWDVVINKLPELKEAVKKIKSEKK